MKRMILLVLIMAVLGCVVSHASPRMAVVRKGEVFKVIYKGQIYQM